MTPYNHTCHLYHSLENPVITLQLQEAVTTMEYGWYVSTRDVARESDLYYFQYKVNSPK
jgi:hypothetical protein